MSNIKMYKYINNTVISNNTFLSFVNMEFKLNRVLIEI